MFDYKLLEAMAIVAEVGGFDKAAKVLCRTQSAVSQRVRLLEELFGQVLIARTTPPHLTAAGNHILRHYRQVMHLEKELLDTLLPAISDEFTALAIGINADSLATWFPDATRSLIKENNLLLDLRVDDQEETHKLLKNGDVVGSISSDSHSIQGCKMSHLGQMDYLLISSPQFQKRWFSNGLTIEAVSKAPAILFDRKDNLHLKILNILFGVIVKSFPAHYVPSPEKLAEKISDGIGYGLLPVQQCLNSIERGYLVNLAPSRCVSVDLYWHYWNINSKILTKFSHDLEINAKCLLGKFRVE